MNPHTISVPRSGTLSRLSIIALTLAVLAAVLSIVGAKPAVATGSTEVECGQWQWVRDIPQSHAERKYKQTIPAVKEVKEYKYKKPVKTYKTQYWAKYQKHVKGRVEKKSGSSWYDTGTDFDWTKWEGDFWNTTGSFKIRDWSDTISPDVIEEGGHGSVSDSYAQNGYTYRLVSERYSYRVIARDDRQVETGTTWEYSDWTTEVRGAPWIKVDERIKVAGQPAYDVYYVTGGGFTTTNTDANWTRESPVSPWVKIADRTVQDPALEQGPVPSVNEPDRGQYPDVPWTKVPGSEVVCPSPVNPAVTQSICVNNVPSTPTVTPATTEGIIYTPSPQGPYSPGQTVTMTATWQAPNQQPATLPAGWVKTSVTTATFTVVLTTPVCTTTTSTPTPTPTPTPVPTPTPTPTPPSTYDCPPGTTWVDIDKDGVKEPGECMTPVKGAVKKRDKCESNNFVSAAKRAGGHYLYKGKVIREGVWLKVKGSVAKIKFVADAGFMVEGKSLFVAKFPNKASCSPTIKTPPPTGKRLTA